MLRARAAPGAPPHRAVLLLLLVRWSGALVAPPSLAEVHLAAIASQLEGRASRVGCPFFKRRLLDAGWAAGEAGAWLRARHKSLPGVFPAVSVAAEAPVALTAAETLAVITADFEERSYYVTGRLTAGAYAPDCFFDSPDPDMPVRSPAIFSSSVRGLFDARTSAVQLLAPPKIVADGVLEAEWRLEGALGLPWRPRVKPFVGRTTFTLDGSGRVASHVEQWSLSSPDAFLSALLPDLGARLGAPPAPPAADLAATARPDEGGLLERYPGLRSPS